MAEPTGWQLSLRLGAQRGRVLRAALLAIPLAWIGFGSIWTVQKDEQGVVTRFGRVDRVLDSGIHLTLPWPFERMECVATTEVRTIPIGLRVVAGAVPGGAGSEGDDVQWMTGDTNIVELKVDVQYVVGDPAAYLYSVADLPDGRRRDALIELAAQAELTRLVARLQVDEVLSVGKARLQREAKLGMQALLDELDLGLRLLTVNIAEVRPPASVIAAFNDVASAESDKERMVTEADGFRRDLLPRERSKANALLQDSLVYQDQVVSRSKGAAARFQSLAEQVRLQPEVSRHRLWLETISRVLGSAETIVYSTEEGQTFRLSVVK